MEYSRPRCDLRPSPSRLPEPLDLGPRQGHWAEAEAGSGQGAAAPSHAHGHPGRVLRRDEGVARGGGLSSGLRWDPPPRGEWGTGRREGRRQVAMRGETALGCGSQGGGWGGEAGPVRLGREEGEEGEGRGRMPRPPPHLARRGHGLALAPRPPRRGLPARPLRPDAAAGGESTQSLTLSLGNGCRKVPAAAISPSSRGVPGALLRPATAPGELWGRPWSAQDSPPRGPGPAHRSAQPQLGPHSSGQARIPAPREPQAPPHAGARPLTFGNPSISPEPVDRQTADRGSDAPAPGPEPIPRPHPGPGSTNPSLNLSRGPASVPGAQSAGAPLGVLDGGSGRGSVMALLA